MGRLTPLLLLCAIISACSKPNEVENPDQAVVVEAYLTPGRDPLVKLRNTLPPEQFFEGLEDTLTEAEVRILVDDQTFVLSEIPAGSGLYSISSATLPIVSGKTYTLEVDSPDASPVRARTTVPFTAEVTAVVGDTITYQQSFSQGFGSLQHPGEFFWNKSENAAGYIIIVEAVEVMSLPISAEPLTADLDSLVSLRERLEGQASADSLTALDRRIADLRLFFQDNISLVRASGDTIRWLRDRQQEDWDDIEGKDWTEGRKWRERRGNLFSQRKIDYWVPVDTLRSDFWWLGVRFEGEYQIRLQSVDQNYFELLFNLFQRRIGQRRRQRPRVPRGWRIGRVRLLCRRQLSRLDSQGREWIDYEDCDRRRLLTGLTAADSWKEVHLAVAGNLAPHPLVVDLSIHRHGHPWF